MISTNFKVQRTYLKIFKNCINIRNVFYIFAVKKYCNPSGGRIFPRSFKC